MLVSLLKFFGILVASLLPVGVLLAILKRKAEERTKEPPEVWKADHESGSYVGETGPGTRFPSVKTVTRKSKGNTKVVRRKEKPYWKRRGWREENGDLIGYYRTKYGIFKGKIKNYRSNPEVYIYNPPKQLNNHDHSQCFFAKGGGKYFIHFSKGVPSPSLAIQNVEKILRGSFQNS